MTSKTKCKGGSCCAVASCNLYLAKAKNSGRSDISFHRFPKDVATQKIWVVNCRRADKFNPANAFICSEHFKSDDFVRDMKSELLGYVPRVKYLKKDAIPTLNLPTSHSEASVTPSAVRRRNKMHSKLIAESHCELLSATLNAKISTSLSEPMLRNNLDAFECDYEKIYNELKMKYDILETDYEKLKIELSLLKQSKNSYMNYKKINESLRSQNEIIQKKLNSTTLLLKQAQKRIRKQQKQDFPNKNHVKNVTKSYLSKIFTANQLDLITEKKKRVRWSKDEISKAFTLRYFSKRAYLFVKDGLHYPLPGISSLQRWASSISMRNGILHDVLRVMELHAQTLSDYEKLTVLMFDEMKVSSVMEYDVLHDEVVGPHDQMQVAMARGIASPWKQPVYIDFDKKMSKEIIFDIIRRLDKIGLKVICCVSDCGGGNLGLMKALEINFENPVFTTPEGRSVVYVPDAPHVLKLIRNWLLDTGFTINDKIINKKPLEALITKVTTELSVCHKLSEEHLVCKGLSRQSVKLATQLFSHTTSTALKHYQPIADIKLCNDTADFIESINNWFDLVNVSHTKNDKRTAFTAPYGSEIHIKEQNSLLSEVYSTILNMRCCGKNNNLQTFQKALLMHINGIRELLNILKNNGLRYLLPSKINQDALENLFSQVRSRGGLNDHPSPLNALFRLRMIILGKNPGIISKSNTIDRNGEEFMLTEAFLRVDLSVKNETECWCTDDVHEDDERKLCDENLTEMAEDAVEYLAGWVAKKYRIKFPELGCISSSIRNEHQYSFPSWVRHLSYGGLIVPNDEFKRQIIRAERIFNKFTKQKIPKGAGIAKQLTNRIFDRMDIPEKYKPVIQTYVKQRIFIRMKYQNHYFSSLKLKRKAKSQLKSIQKLRRLAT